MSHIEYRVSSGDTLSMIARRHRVTEEALARLNGLSDINRLWAGQVLRIPRDSVTAPRPVPRPKTHRVQAGDTLSQIAQRHHVTVRELASVNGISNPDLITIGLVLTIPEKTEPTPRGLSSESGQAPVSAASRTGTQSTKGDKARSPASKTPQRLLTSAARVRSSQPMMLASLGLTALPLSRPRETLLADAGDKRLYGPFQVRISGKVGPEELAVLTVWQVFGLSGRSEAEAFVATWEVIINDFKEITDQEVRQGFTLMYFEANFYHQILGTKFGGEPAGTQRKNQERRRKFGALGKTEQAATLERVDAEFEKRTGGRKFSESKTQEDRELWESIQDDILREDEESRGRFDALPKEIKALVLPGSEKPKPEQYAQLARIGEKLQELSAMDLAFYKQLPKTLTQNLDLFEQSVEAFVRFRQEYQAALEKAVQDAGAEKTLEQRLDETWRGVDFNHVRAQPAGYREAEARRIAWEQTKIRLEHMSSHPGETAVDMAKGLNPVSVADAVIRDVKEAASGDKTRMARWAAGVGGVGKISGWVAGVAALAYVALLFIPGVNVAIIAQTALIAGFTAIAISIVESELRVQAAVEARTGDEYHYNVGKISEAQFTAIMGLAMLVGGYVLKLLGAIRLPGRLQSVSHALGVAQQALLKVTGLGPALESIRATLRKAILGERAGLPEALAEQILKLRKSMRRLEALSGDEFLKHLARGDAALKELTGITPEQARQFLDIQQKPAGAGLGEKLRQDFLRALRDAPGEAQARVDRSLTNMNEALAELDAAQSPRDLAAAIERAQERFDAKTLADEAVQREQAALRQRLQEELLKEPTAPREPTPAAEAPTGMSENLKAVRGSFDASTADGRAAIEQFDTKFKELGGNSAKMEKIVNGLKNAEQQTGKKVQERFTEDWNKANRGTRAPYGKAVGEVPELRVRIDVLKADIEAYAKSRPHVRGVKEWLEKLEGEAKQLDKMLAGDLEAIPDKVTGARANIDGIQAEFRRVFGETGVIATGHKVPPRPGGTPTFDVDILADNGRTWIDVKSVEPFGVESSTWKGKPGTGGGKAKKGLRAMAEDLCEAAKNNPVDGQVPKVVYDFQLGVSEAVAKALKAIGGAKGVKLEVRGPVLPDTKVVPIPGRMPDDYDEAIER